MARRKERTPDFTGVKTKMRLNLENLSWSDQRKNRARTKPKLIQNQTRVNPELSSQT